MALTRDQILQSEDLPRELVSIPEWGGDIWVRTLTGKERDTLESSVANVNAQGKSNMNLINLRARLCSMTIVDEDGNRLFSDKDVEELGKKNASALDRAFEVAQRLAGLTSTDVKKLEKN